MKSNCRRTMYEAELESLGKKFVAQNEILDRAIKESWWLSRSQWYEKDKEEIFRDLEVRISNDGSFEIVESGSTTIGIWRVIP